jgi:hypothetical protein
MIEQVIFNLIKRWILIATAITGIAAAGTLAVLTYGFIQGHQSNLVELKKTAVSVPYDDLASKPEDHIGQIVRFRGKVIQVAPGEHDDKDVILIIWVGKGLTSLNDVLYVDYQTGAHEPRVMKNDVAEFWGKFTGIKAADPNHGNVEVPHVVAYGIERIE